MSPAYPHLLINHVPVIGVYVATVLLAVALRRRTVESAVYGYWTLVICAAFAILTFVSGNFAPPAIQSMAGVTANAISLHQIVGLAAMIVAVLAGLLAAIPLVLTNIAANRGVLIGYLIVAIVLDAVFAYAAFTGGTLGHPELR